MVARLDMVQDVSQKTLPNRLSANAVDIGEVLLSSRPLFDPHQSSDVKTDSFGLKLDSRQAFQDILQIMV
jgi:hypothetical protein